MASLKHVIFVALAATVAAAEISGWWADNHDIDVQTGTENSPLDVIVGRREPDDNLVHQQYFIREAAPKKIIAFRPFDVPDEYTITQVRVLDQTKGQGGPATYEYGGPGMNRVLLGFTSEPNQKIHYSVQLYAKL